MEAFDFRQPQPRHGWLRILAALAVASLAGLLPAQDDTAAADASKKFDLSPMAVAYVLDGEPVSVGAYQEVIRFVPPGPLRRYGAAMADLNTYEPAIVADSIRDFVQTKAIAAKARAEGMELDASSLELLARDEDNQAYYAWLEKNKVLDTYKATEDEIAAFYEENKDERFKIQEEIRMRHIYISTYDQYEVKEGDTLESIAEAIAGDAASAGDILDAVTKQPRADKVEGKNGEMIDPQPLQVGELLMVPMSDEMAKAKGVTEKIENAYKALEEQGAGAFEEVARRFSESDDPAKLLIVRPSLDKKPMLKQVRTEFEKLEDGEFSAPFRTRHGYQIILRVSHTPEGYRPLESVRASIESELQQQARQKVYDEKIAELWAADKSVEIDEEVLSKAFDESQAKEVIFQIEDVKYLGENFRRDFLQRLDEDADLATRRDALKKLPLIQQHLTQQDIEASGIKESETYLARIKAIEDILLTRQYENKIRQDFKYEPTEEELEEEFAKSLDSYSNTRHGNVWQISLKVDPEGKYADDEDMLTELRDAAYDRLNEITKDISSVEQFEEAALIYSQDEYAEKAGKVGSVNVYTDDRAYAPILQRPEPNGLVGPMPVGDYVRSYWVSDVTQKYENVTLDDVRERVTANLIGQKREMAVEKFRESIRDSYKLEIPFENAG
ncbi:MAG: PPIC-type domain [Candidatus Sumerlaeota bacterium]|nr:PPIC-type domain [Candidatus Sumerlaeota bacterium]